MEGELFLRKVGDPRDVDKAEALIREGLRLLAENGRSVSVEADLGKLDINGIDEGRSYVKDRVIVGQVVSIKVEL